MGFHKHQLYYSEFFIIQCSDPQDGKDTFSGKIITVIKPAQDWQVTGYESKGWIKEDFMFCPIAPATKPPRSLIPRDIFEQGIWESRLGEIEDAMLRFIDAGKPIPREWMEEYLDLAKALNIKKSLLKKLNTKTYWEPSKKD